MEGLEVVAGERGSGDGGLRVEVEEGRREGGGGGGWRMEVVEEGKDPYLLSVLKGIVKLRWR